MRIPARILSFLSSLLFHSSFSFKISCSVFFLIFSFVWVPKTFPGRLFNFVGEVYAALFWSKHFCCQVFWLRYTEPTLWLLWAILPLETYLLSCFLLCFLCLLTKHAWQNNDKNVHTFLIPRISAMLRYISEGTLQWALNILKWGRLSWILQMDLL